MQLFFSPGACSLAPHIMLRESGQAFTLQKVDTAKHLTETGVDFYTINPKGQVPLLVLDDGTTLSEGPIIAQFVADQAARVDLMPQAGSVARYKVMEWQNYITSELHKSFTPLFNPTFDAVAKSLHATLLRKKYEWVNTQLANQQFLTGDAFTAADAYLFTVTGWAKHVSLSLNDLSHLQAFLTRVAERPAVQQALRAEGLIR